VQNEGANLGASAAAWIGRAAGPPSPRNGSGAAGREAGFNLEGSSRGRAARLRASRARRPNGRAQDMPSNRCQNRSISNRHLAIRNGCKLMKTNDGCTV
jgi:hypothetical protein